MDPAYDSNYMNSYVYHLAELFKNGDTVDGVTYPGLLPNLNLYIEYSNEIWNWSGPWAGDGATFAAISAAGAADNADYQKWVAMGNSLSNIDAGMQDWLVLRQKDISAIFRQVYGNAAMPSTSNGAPNADPRIRPLYEWQYGGGFNGGQGYSAAVLTAVDTEFGLQANYYLYGGGGAFYSNPNIAGSTANAVFSNITLATAPDPASTVMSDASICAAFGLKDVAYEGGFEFDGNATTGQQEADDDPRTIPYVEQTVDQFYEAGGALPIAYAADGQ
jgi:hypothetical protein